MTEHESERFEVAEQAAPAGPDRPRRRPPPAVVLGVVVLLLLLAAAVATSWSHRAAAARDEARDHALTAARTRVPALLSYTPATVIADLESEARWLTGGFKKQYADLVTETIAPAAVEGKVSTEAEVSAAGVVSASKDRVVVLMFVNVTTTTPVGGEPEVRGGRLRVTMVEVDGDWLIRTLDPR
jgi:Mce-associated membrane protein